MNVVMVDLLTQTPFYDRYLSASIAPLVDRFTLYAIRFHYEPEYLDHLPFHRSPGWIDRAGSLALGSQGLRRAAKLVEYVLNWAFLLCQFRVHPPDVVHIQWLPLLSRTKLELGLVKLLRRFGIPVVYTVHNYLPHEVTPSSRRTYRSVYSQVDQLIVHTQSDMDRLEMEFGIGRHKVNIVPLGPQFAEYAAAAANDDVSDARSAWGIGEKSLVLLMLGVVRPYKGIDEAIRALAQVHDLEPDCKLIIAGNPLDASYAQHLRQLTSELGLDACVHWHLEYVPTSQIGLLHRVADVVLFPYRDISQSAAFMTAAAFGNCTLSTQVGGLAELVQDGVTGIQIPSADPGDIAVGLRRCFALSDRQRREMGSRLRDYVHLNSNWDLIGQKTVQVYQKACGQ